MCGDVHEGCGRGRTCSVEALEMTDGETARTEEVAFVLDLKAEVKQENTKFEQLAID